MKTIYIGKIIGNLGEELRALDHIFSFIEGNKKSEIMLSIIDNMRERLSNYHQGHGNCLEDYYWDFTPWAVKYQEPDGDYFYINFYTGEITYGNEGDE